MNTLSRLHHMMGFRGGGGWSPGRRGLLPSIVLPFLAAVASLGFEGAEAGILHAPAITSVVGRPTLGEEGLRSAALRRTGAIRTYASRYGIDWDLSRRIYDAAVDAALDVDLAYALVRVESSFRQGAIGPAGSIGYTQVQPNTARWLDPDVTRDRLFEVDTNLRLGFGYLRLLIDRYGDVRLALLAYNRGPGTVEAALAAGQDPANGYAQRVLRARMR